MRYLVALTMTLMYFQAIAHASEKVSPTAAYNEQLAEIAKKALNAELLKHPERLNGVSMKLQYKVDRNGRVHDVQVLSRTPDRWAEKTAARVLAAIKFPPIPIDVQLEVRAGYIEAEAKLSFSAQATSGWDKNSAYYGYNMRVHKMLEDDLMPAFSAQPQRMEVDYEFYLDPQGRVTSLKTHAKAGGQWAEQTIAHSIRNLKFPPVSPQVFNDLEQKPPLKIFGTMSWEPTQGSIYEWQLSEKQALSIANRALAANHIDPSKYRWHQQVWRIIDSREWFIQFSARYPGPGGNDVLVVLNDESRKASVRVLPLRWSGRVETVVPQYKY